MHNISHAVFQQKPFFNKTQAMKEITEAKNFQPNLLAHLCLPNKEQENC